METTKAIMLNGRYISKQEALSLIKSHSIKELENTKYEIILHLTKEAKLNG